MAQPFVYNYAMMEALRVGDWNDEMLDRGDEMNEGFAKVEARFERVDERLAQTATRQEMNEGFAELRKETREGFGELRGEMNGGFGELRGE